jgi:transposase
MLIIGCDFHSRFQQIAMLDTQTGEIVERRLEHGNGEAERFYRSLPHPVRVGLESSGHAQWFERLLAELGHELWVGDAARIRAAVVRKQKTDARDASHILDLLVTNRFPRVWRPSPAERDVRQLLVHRQKLVWARIRVKTQLQTLAMNQGVCIRRKLWASVGRRALENLTLGPWTSRRRNELLQRLDQLNGSVEELDRAVEAEARKRADVVRLMTHRGVGPVTALAFVLTLGPVERFRRSKQVVSYLGLNPQEHSSATRPTMARLINTQASTHTSNGFDGATIRC